MWLTVKGVCRLLYFIRRSIWFIFVKLVFSSSRVLGHDLSARWGSFDSEFCLCTQWYQRDIISLYWNEFDSVSSLVAHSKQTQQAFGLAYWCPMGVGLWAKMKICAVWFWGKMSSTLSLFPPVLCFFQCSVFVPCSLVSLCSPSPGFCAERVGDRCRDLRRVRLWICVALPGNICTLGVRICAENVKEVPQLQWHLVDSPTGTRVPNVVPGASKHRYSEVQ